MPNYNNELVEFDAELRDSTERAWLFIIEDDDVWIPKSICEWSPTTPDGVIGTVEVPMWFAEENKLG